jgi:hypothetical protein
MEISDEQRVDILHYVPHFLRLQRLIFNHYLLKAASLGYQTAQDL